MNRITKRLALPVGAALILGSSGFAYMASNSVPETFAGEGFAEISPYNVSDVTYTTDPGPDADIITAVSFVLDQAAAADNVRVTILENPNGDSAIHNYFNCSLVSGPVDNLWTCNQNGQGTTGDANQPAAMLPSIRLGVSAAQ